MKAAATVISAELLKFPAAERLAHIATLEVVLSAARAATIAEVRSENPPMTWAKIGDALGMSKQSAHDWYQRNAETETSNSLAAFVTCPR